MGTALGSTIIGAGVGTASSTAAYTLSSGDSFNSREMVSEAAIGTITGAFSALTGPAVVSANVANSGTAMLARAGVNALGAQASHIIHNEYFDEGKYPSGGELAGAAALGAGTSGIGDMLDSFVSGAVTALSGSRTAGQVAGSLTYNAVKNFGASYTQNQGLNFIDNVTDTRYRAEY